MVDVNTNTTDPTLEKITTAPHVYWICVALSALLYIILVGVGIATWNIMLLPFFNVGGIFALLALIHFFLSWTVVETTEWAGFYFYGRALKMAESGPHFKPWLLVQDVRAPKGLQQFQAPGEPEEVFHGDEKEVLPKGMVWPIRVTSRAPKADETGHLDVQMTFEWPFYVQYQILDFFMFVSGIGSFEQAKRLIRDSGEAVQKRFAATRTLRMVIEGAEEIDDTLDNRIRELTNKWGMQIFEARTLAPNISHSLATELHNVPIERLRVEQVVTRAGGERTRLEEEGAGAAKAKLDMLTSEASGREAFLKGEAEGLKAKKRALRVDGATIIAAEVASDAFNKANGVLMGGSAVSELVATVQTTSDALKKGK